MQAETRVSINTEPEHLQLSQARYVPILLLWLWFWLWLSGFGCVVVVRATSAMNSESGLFLLKPKRNRNELVLIVVVAMVAWHYGARIANLHLRPCVLGEGIDTEQTIASVRGKNRKV